PTEPADPDADKYGGDLIIGSGNATNTMDMHYNTSTLGNLQWSLHVYEGLAVLDANGKIYSLLADYEESPDGLKYTYTLKKGVKFSNGDEVTMEDVEASIRRGWAAGITTEASFNKMWATATVTFTDTQFIVEFPEYNVNYASTFHSPGSSYRIMPKEICEKYPVTGGTTAANGITWGGELTTLIGEIEDVIGTGPYVLTKWTDNADVVLTRNEHYVPVTEGNEDAIGVAAPRKAYCDTITFSYNGDAASRTAATMAHEYQIGSVQNAMVDAALALGIERGDAGTTWTHGIFFNLDESNADSPIADVNVRKAIRACLDVNAIMLAIVSGDQERVNLDPYAVTKDTVYASTKMEDSGEWNVADKELAKQYLAQSSYNGEPIVYLVHSSGNFYNAAMAIVPQLEEIGLNIELMVVDNGSHSALRKDPATGHDIGCWEVQKREDNPVLHSTFVTGTQGWWSSDAKDAALNVMRHTPTGSAESIAAYEDYLDAVIDECPYILFGHPTGVTYNWPEVERNQKGQVNYYYWNSYFVD
ncbi:MAG: hypothetical protein IKK61_09860, partial [Clostridia bacterium]|nr:hypothetical protein [Clostridia bacterium]